MRFREAYKDIELYEPGRIPIDTDLSDNTNLFGLSPSTGDAFAKLSSDTISRYPSVFAKNLKEAIAEEHGVSVENVTTGCGSDDVIDSAMRAFCEPGDVIAYPWPTFGVVSTFARMNAARPVAVPALRNFAIDVDELIAKGASVTYVCSPNNPTGTAITRDELGRLENELDGILLLDEAYADFGEADYAQFAAQSIRTVSMRTMSKVCGLAGLRVGYAIGPTKIIHEIEKSRGPYKVGGVAETVACRVLSTDRAWRRDVVEKTRMNRTRLADELTRRKLAHYPSAGNFILVSLPDGHNAVETNNALRQLDVTTRPLTALPFAGECLRVTVGPWEMMEKFLNALDNVLSR
ncbi:MAG TPA: histidinol-phosphate transaminase [Longimicrobiales bacterium]|nr:histidinol-phosphate transaminase [Longimicrobiales bacterium]